MSKLIEGLTLFEYFRLHGSLPRQEVEYLLDERAQIASLLQALSDLDFEIDPIVRATLPNKSVESIARLKTLCSGFLH